MSAQLRASSRLSARVIRTCRKHNPLLASAEPDNNRTANWTSHRTCKLHHSSSHILTKPRPVSSLSHLELYQTCRLQHARHFSMDSFRHYYSPDFPPVGYAQKLLETVYDTTGLPWWGTILLTTFVLRSLITLPLGVVSMRNMIKLTKLQPVLKDKSELLKMEIAAAIKMYKWDKKIATAHYNVNMKRIVKQSYIEENCHPAKSSMVFWFQLPIWLGLSLALRNMSGTMPFSTNVIFAVVHPELSVGGALWFTNFIVPDPLFILPVICASLNLVNCEVMALSKEDRTTFQKVVTNVFRGLSLIVLPIGLVLPSCMVYYWTCSSVLGLAQTLAMKSPTIRRSLRIPLLPNESKTPYSDLIHVAKRRYSKPFRRKQDSD